jgi:hypothetical protein
VQVRVLCDEAGADPNKRDTVRNIPPFMLACEYGHIAILKYFLEEAGVTDDFSECVGGTSSVDCACFLQSVLFCLLRRL